MGGLTRHNGNAQHQSLVHILRGDFRNRHIETLPGFVHQAPADLPLVFQRSGVGDDKAMNMLARKLTCAV